jgi:elongation factor Ts
MGIVQEDIPQEVIDRERAIYAAQAKESGKPDNIIEKMVDGKMRKFFQESVLLEQSS